MVSENPDVLQVYKSIIHSILEGVGLSSPIIDTTIFISDLTTTDMNNTSFIYGFVVAIDQSNLGFHFSSSQVEIALVKFPRTDLRF